MTDCAGVEQALVAPPGDAPDVCEVCRDWSAEDEPRCAKCGQIAEQLGALAPLVPISLYRKPSELRNWLTFYKHPGEEARPEFGPPLAAVLRCWLDHHGDAFAAWCGGFDAACVVPSTGGRRPSHPLVALIDEHVPRLAALREDLLVESEGDVAHRSPSATGYRARPAAAGRRVLLVDDVLTTGAHAQSAAHALRQAGAAVPAVLVIGRRLNPEWRPEVAAIWERQATRPFRFADPPWWRAGG